MYESNYDALKRIVAEHAVIRHVSRHRKPDGSFDLEGNRKIWNDALDRLELIKLWENGTPGFEPEKDASFFHPVTPIFLYRRMSCASRASLQA